ncbi:MAG: PilC/PilY family type IV pilus protein, partial [Gemmatimonadales bacterium]
TDDLFTLSLKPNVLILVDGSGSMTSTDGGKYSVSYTTKVCTEVESEDGQKECDGSQTRDVSDLDVDGIANTRNDVALSVVLDLLDANGDGQVDAADEAALGVRLGLMYYTSGGDSGLRDGGDDGHPRGEIDYSFETIAPMGTPYADIKKAIIDPIFWGEPDPNIVVGSLRGCGATPSEYSPDPNACGSGQAAEYTSGVLTTPPAQTRWGYALNDTPTAEALEYVEHYWLPEQLFSDSDAVCRQNFIILITDGRSDGFTDVDTIAASLYNGGTPKAHGLGVPPGFKDRFGNTIPIPESYTYQFEDKDDITLTRDFTKKLASGVDELDIKLPSDVPGASPPASCPADCYAYDPNGDDPDKVPPETLGYVGGLDSATYGNGTQLEKLNLLSSNILDPEPEYYAKTFAVGFSGGDPSELDATAAAGGTGTAFFPDTAAGLTSAVQSAFTTIQTGALSVASPAVPAARVGSSNALYLASFTPSDDPFWYGQLTAYPLQSDGTVQTDANGNIIATPLWEAHTVLNGTSSGARDIKTVVSGTTVEDFAKIASVRTALNVTQDLDGNAVVNSNDGNWLIDYVRGTNGTNPAWKLGDIYHSSPVLIGPPSSSYVDLNLDRTIDTSFTTFRISYATRDRVLYAGSNAGVLHAFHAGTWTGSDYDTGTGAERWAFVPPNLLPQLQDMVSTHTYYVDGPPKAADVWLDGNSDGVKAANEWHTVLVTGERRGGNAYFALDITNPGTAAFPNPPAYLWTFTDLNLGQTWSQAAIGKVRLSLDSGSTTIERWVAFVGGGYVPSSGTYTYQFTDKDGKVLTRDFTKQIAPDEDDIDVKLASAIPGATPPATCAADCFAYDPNGASDPASVPPATLGYVGGLDSAIY